MSHYSTRSQGGSQARLSPSSGGLRWGLLGIGAVAILASIVALSTVSLLSNFTSAQAGCESGHGTTLPLAGGTVLAATVYDDMGSGAYGLGLVGHNAYAELGLHSRFDNDRSHANRIGVALGLGKPLAPLTKLEIQAPNGTTVVAEKRDIGMGGPPIQGHQRAIDLWTTTRTALGLDSNWSGLVRVAPGADGTIRAEAGSASENEPPLPSQGQCAQG